MSYGSVTLPRIWIWIFMVSTAHGQICQQTPAHFLQVTSTPDTYGVIASQSIVFTGTTAYRIICRDRPRFRFLGTETTSVMISSSGYMVMGFHFGTLDISDFRSNAVMAFGRANTIVDTTAGRNVFWSAVGCNPTRSRFDDTLVRSGATTVLQSYLLQGEIIDRAICATWCRVLDTDSSNEYLYQAVLVNTNFNTCWLILNYDFSGTFPSDTIISLYVVSSPLVSTLLNVVNPNAFSRGTNNGVPGQYVYSCDPCIVEVDEISGPAAGNTPVRITVTVIAAIPCTIESCSFDGVTVPATMSGNVSTCMTPSATPGQAVFLISGANGLQVRRPWTFTTDSNPCSPQPCLNDGNCTASGMTFSCECPRLTIGNMCQTRITCRDNSDCNSGEICNNAGAANSQCNILQGCTTDANCLLDNDFCNTAVNPNRCDCLDGFEGANCTAVECDLPNKPCPEGQMCAFDDTIDARCMPTHCAGNLCDVNGTDRCLTLLDGNFYCICRKGYGGSRCEMLGPCLSEMPCRNDGKCLDWFSLENPPVEMNEYICICEGDYTGRNCSDVKDGCTPNPCTNNTQCTLNSSGFSCACPPGYTGALCENSICYPNPCEKYAECVVSETAAGGYECPCLPGYAGLTCDSLVCDVLGLCEPNGVCRPTWSLPFYSCQCTTGWTGPQCQQDIDECAMGDSPCIAGATCRNTPGSYNCECPPGVSGPGCDRPVDSCQLYGNPCGPGTCIPRPGNQYRCDCDPGFQFLSRTCIDINECILKDCGFGAVCLNTYGSYFCRCLTGFKGDNMTGCIQEDCGLGVNPCQNGGTCSVTPLGVLRCRCRDEFTGRRCELRTGCPCQNGGLCYQTEDGRDHCLCPPGYKGRFCGEEVLECTEPGGDKPCQNGGACYSVHGYYVCRCLLGYVGSFCDDDLDECGTGLHHCGSRPCINTRNGYRCECSDGYSGVPCTDIDECTESPCENDGVCENTEGSFTCDCPSDYTGPLCDQSTGPRTLILIFLVVLCVLVVIGVGLIFFCCCNNRQYLTPHSIGNVAVLDESEGYMSHASGFIKRDNLIYWRPQPGTCAPPYAY